MSGRGLVPPLTVTGWLRWDVVKHLLPESPTRVLDIGAGAGSIGWLLPSHYEYVGIEPDPVSFAIAKRRIGGRGRLLNCRFEDLTPAQDFDLVCAFEVLEHLEDDAAALGQWIRHLRPGGWLLLSVPKDPRRYGPVNARVGDLRRYDRDDLASLLANAGLQRIVTVAYGSPYGNVQESIQNQILRLRPTRAPVAERTAASGRFRLPPVWATAAVRGAALPLQYAQRPFSRLGIGTGVVARGQLKVAVDASHSTIPSLPGQ